MMTDLIADLLTRVRNAQRQGHKTVKVKKSAMTRNILEVLLKEGFIASYSECDMPKSTAKGLEVVLKYYRAHEPVISQARRMSKSGRRVYVSHDELPRVARGLGISILSTSKGVMSDREARKQKIGGELLALVS